MSDDQRKVAVVTGASRGIGKATAIRLARAGYDVAITARTVNEGEAREHSATALRSDVSPLPGSLATTAALIETEGQQVLSIASDLLDRASLGALIATVLQRWGHIDVLVNNAIYVGPGQMDLLADTTIEMFTKHLEGIAIAPLVLANGVLPQMIRRGGGAIINVTSGAALKTPPAAAGSGGWGVSYGAAKAAMHRIAGFIALEHGDDGIRSFNVQPGFIASERMLQDLPEMYAQGAAPPDVVAAVIVWLATNDDALTHNGDNIESQPFCREMNLLPEWSENQPA